MTDRRSEKPITLGIVGGVGSGKSFTAAELVAQGAAIFDADLEAKKLYDDPSVLDIVRKRWPDVVNDAGAVDRQKLAQVVFAPDETGRAELVYLNSVLHPRLLAKFEQWLGSLDGHEFAVLDAPLLFEVGWDKHVDYIVYVDACEETRRRRTVARGWSPDEISRRESRQVPLDVKKARADFVVNASRDDSAMDRQVFSILESIRQIRRSHS